VQHGIVESAKGFPGYQKIDVFPPADPAGEEWAVVIHFDDRATLRGWLDSPVRAEWVARMEGEFGTPEVREVPNGFNAWFTGATGAGVPPRWKVALSVLLPLYPTVMVLAILGAAPVDRFGLAVAMLISNILSVSILQWLVTPVLGKVLAPWLRANGPSGRRVTVVGLVLIVAALAAMTAVFHAMAS
jgi:hypothetical protein